MFYFTNRPVPAMDITGQNFRKLISERKIGKEENNENGNGDFLPCWDKRK